MPSVSRQSELDVTSQQVSKQVSIKFNMNIDLDDLLSEITLETSSHSTPNASAKSKSILGPRVAEDELDLDVLLDELDGGVSSYPISTSTQTQSQRTNSRTQNQPLKSTLKLKQGIKCTDLLHKCQSLRCLGCDFRVVALIDREWTSGSEYLYFRNIYPDVQKLTVNTKARNGGRALCCQCSWVSTPRESEVPSKWRCSGICG
jgi:Retinal Maintenance